MTTTQRTSLVGAAFVSHLTAARQHAEEDQRAHGDALLQPRTPAEQALAAMIAGWVQLATGFEQQAGGEQIGAHLDADSLSALRVLQGLHALTYTAVNTGRLDRALLRALLHDVATAAGYPPDWQRLDA